ncbi:MAG TPA: hypothetical protein VJ717_13165 [Gemmatimonadaceae bacterium]|nr:hypothetical protein [Gemmatimonadaceae bacterium]
MTRDRWWPQLRDGRDSAVVVEASGNSLSDSGAQRAENSIRSLGQATGPAYVNITPEDLAALIVREAGRTPLPLKDATAGVVGDRLWLRGTLDLRQLRAQGALGTIGVLLGDEEEVELRGTLDIVQPGLAQFRVAAFKVRDISLPSAAIPRLIAQIYRGERPPGVSANGVPFPVPPYIGDVRIANGRITLYKTVDGPR